MSSNFTNLLDVPLESSVDVQNSQCLLLLPYLTTVPAMKKVNNLHSWKPSRSEICESFIMHVPCESNIESCTLSHGKKMSEMHRPTLPYVMYVGDTFKDPTKVYCVVNDILFPVKCITDGVDLCFKIYFATHCDYPEGSTERQVKYKKNSLML